MVTTWAIDDGPVQTEDLTSVLNSGDVKCVRPSAALQEHLANPRCRVVIHNSAFDRTHVRHCWDIEIPTERIWDTMVQALGHGLPGGLDKLCEIFKLSEALAKGKDGSALIQLFCKPLPKNSKIRRATRNTHPVKWKEFLVYAAKDIPSMRELKRLMPTWNLTERERALWRLDQTINDRGFKVDLELADAAIAAVNAEQARMRVRTRELTNGEVSSATQRDVLLAHLLSEYGVALPDMAKDTLERRLADETLPEALRELLRIRLSTSTSSTAKYAAAKRSASADGRLRGTLQFCGAQRTSRWSGRLFQPQNMMRPNLKQKQIDMAIEAIKSGDSDLILDDLMRAAANAMRGMIVASNDNSLRAADLANIEGRLGAWLSGETWKLKAFADYDTLTSEGEGFQDSDGVWRKGPDLYIMAYVRAYGVDPATVTKEQRQIGKVMELALLYYGGVGAFLAFAEVYRLDLEQMASDAYAGLPKAAREAAEGKLAWHKRKALSTYDLSDRAYVVCQAFVSMWRDVHAETAAYWPELEAAAKRAIQNPGIDVPARKLVFRRDGAWLRMILPSGRSVCYPSPRVEHGKITYLGVNQYTRKWGRLGTYSGKLLENACQALARDVMAWNMPLIEEEGFEIVLTVHDEIITDVPTGSNYLTVDRLSALLAANPPWLSGCPLAASGFEAVRYRKDG